MNCRECGQANPDDARYCLNCGSPMGTGPADEMAGSRPPDDRGAYGGFWVRVGAYLLDALIIGVPQVLAQIVISPETMVPRDPGDPMPATEVTWILVNVVVGWLYWAGMHSSQYQATLGKRVLGLRVVDYDGERISFMRATGRHFATILSGMILMIGYIMVAFTRRRQALHDLIAQTLVVRKEWLR
ncbi:RDD family protein [Thioalkalivibrio sp.]|uniref:RDD family protein n=1 Tax=Thioalkalivibrio sp. TaxID=2093813 RepID=UPI0035658753